MRAYLTIGELAELLGISTSKIRYYEKAGLLNPCKIDNNGYRLYDFEQLDKLDVIILLRRLGVSLKHLGNLLNDYSINDYIDSLSSSLITIDNKLDELQKQKMMVKNRLDSAVKFLTENHSFNIRRMPKRELVCVYTGEIYHFSIKEVYNLFNQTQLPFSNIYNSSYHVYHKNSIYSMFMLNNNDPDYDYLPRLVLPAGDYLYHGVLVGKDNKISEEVDKIYEYIKNQGYLAKGELILNENYRHSQYYSDKFYINIQVKIERN